MDRRQRKMSIRENALAGGFKRAKTMNKDQHMVINLSGRGDKDIFNIARAFPQRDWTEFLQREAERSTDQINEHLATEIAG